MSIMETTQGDFLEAQLLDRLVIEQQMAKLMRRYRRKHNERDQLFSHAEAQLDGDNLLIKLDGQPMKLTRAAAVELAWSICSQMEILRSR